MQIGRPNFMVQWGYCQVAGCLFIYMLIHFKVLSLIFLYYMLCYKYIYGGESVQKFVYVPSMQSWAYNGA